MFYYQEKLDLKILLLQLRRHRPILHVFLEGELGRKKRLDTKKSAEKIREQVAIHIDQFRWKQIPRARVAVSMTFFPQANQVPALHNLVKFYLDELRLLAFTDDRQVSYLAAECWLPRSQQEDTNKENESKIYIKVERLANYQAKFDLYFTLLRNENFREYLRNSRRELLIDDEDNEDSLEELLEPKYLSNSALFPDKTRELINKINREERQTKLLSVNKIYASDRPGLPRWVKHLPNEYRRIRELEPLSVNLGNLPLKGETNLYKDRIRESLKRLPATYKSLVPIRIPVELDVKLYSRKPIPSKDLDNIMRDVAPIFQEELLHTTAYLPGYRIYVADTNNVEYSSDFLRLKLLPMNAISEFERRVGQTFEMATDWLREELHRF